MLAALFAKALSYACVMIGACGNVYGHPQVKALCNGYCFLLFDILRLLTENMGVQVEMTQLALMLACSRAR